MSGGITTEGRPDGCDLCDGEPTCVNFCEAGALKFVEADVAHLAMKRASGARFPSRRRSRRGIPSLLAARTSSNGGS